MRIRTMLLASLGGGVFAVVAVLAGTPSPIVAQRLSADSALRLDRVPQRADWPGSCSVWGRDTLPGPEDLDADAAGTLYTGLHDGRLVRLTPGADGELVAATLAVAAGRPNGVTALADGGLLASYDYGEPGKRIDEGGAIEVLGWLTGADAAVGRDGTVYHPVLAPWKRTGNVGVDFALMLLEAAPSGTLRATDPATGRGETIAEGLILPDGVALSPDEDFLLVGEFGAARITRVWLRGPRAGMQETLLEGLPGFPDGLASDGRGTFFVALPVARNAALDWLHRHPRLKEWLARALVWIGPQLMTGEPSRDAGGGVVLAFDGDGRVTRIYRDDSGLVGPMITAVEPVGDFVYLGSLMGWGIARCPR